jgi:hypothetical protein
MARCGRAERYRGIGEEGQDHHLERELTAVVDHMGRGCGCVDDRDIADEPGIAARADAHPERPVSGLGLPQVDG